MPLISVTPSIHPRSFLLQWVVNTKTHKWAELRPSDVVYSAPNNTAILQASKDEGTSRKR